jgi:hypothetical protein
MDLTFSETYVEIDWTALSADQSCVFRDPEVNRSCTMAIHTGYSCDDPQAAWYSTNNFEDPWLEAPYRDGNGFLRIENCRSYIETIGRVLIIYGRDGTSIACENIIPESFLTRPTLSLTDVPGAPGYSGTDVVDLGAMFLSFHDTGLLQIAYFDLIVDADCSTGNAPSPGSNYCKLQLYNSTNCNDLSGGHLFNMSVLGSTDPWLYTTYHSGDDTGNILSVDFGYGFADVVDQAALVITDADGTITACAVLQSELSYVDSYSPIIIDSATHSVTFGSVVVILWWLA